MQWLFELLANQPVLLVIILIGVIQGVGGLIARTARQGMERRQAEARRERMDELDPADPGSEAAPAAEGPRSPEDIAAEIRRVMGLDEPRTEPEPEPQFEVEPEPVRIQAEPSHGGNLARDLSERERILAERFESQGIALSGRRGGGAAAAALSGRDHIGSTYLDLSSPVRALVAMEVLGKPKALRDDEY